LIDSCNGWLSFIYTQPSTLVCDCLLIIVCILQIYCPQRYEYWIVSKMSILYVMYHIDCVLLFMLGTVKSGQTCTSICVPKWHEWNYWSKLYIHVFINTVLGKRTAQQNTELQVDITC
jgi:hypothetical protein